jgi:hypothetical protein
VDKTSRTSETRVGIRASGRCRRGPEHSDTLVIVRPPLVVIEHFDSSFRCGARCSIGTSTTVERASL